jgi:hypothetical protein
VVLDLLCGRCEMTVVVVFLGSLGHMFRSLVLFVLLCVVIFVVVVVVAVVCCCC